MHSCCKKEREGTVSTSRIAATVALFPEASSCIAFVGHSFFASQHCTPAANRSMPRKNKPKPTVAKSESKQLDQDLARLEVRCSPKLLDTIPRGSALTFFACISCWLLAGGEC